MKKSIISLEKEYLKNYGEKCLFCKSKSIKKVGPQEEDGDIIYQDKTCMDCGKDWIAIYTLTGIDIRGEEE